ncbi:Pdia4 protein [Loa loa]|uniref:Protein disulfide-isomerase n=1 Tax=Loa loa TaxID=7209 RepID=A0A1S0U3Z1_LOALO|nr:Pdia4 protein [Loa loa]EFO24730.2 Pdia4 protein [Loa loa]
MLPVIQRYTVCYYRCDHCKALAPEYAKAAKKLKVPLAKVDAVVETKLAETYNIKGFPTLKLWRSGKDPIDYNGGRESDEIVQWVSEKTDPTYESPSSAVAKLTKEVFSEFITLHRLVLIKFYAPWCGHCKKLAPEYEKAAKKLKGTDIMLAEVDSTTEKNLSAEFDITGYPTLYIFRNGKKFDYKGPRDAEGIVKYMLEQAEPALRKITSVKEAQHFMRKDDVTVIGFFSDDKTELLDSLSNAAEMMRNDFNIAVCLEVDVKKHFQIDSDRIVMFFPEIYWSKYEPKRIAYGKEVGTVEDLVTFLQENSTPLVGHRTKKNVATRYTKFPLVVIYYNVDFSLEYREGTQYWRKKVLEIASQYRKDKYHFAVSDEDEFADELAAVGLDDSGLEHNVLVFGYDGKKYPMRPNEFDNELAENLPAFMKKLSSGKIKPFVKSAPLPKDDKGPVKTVAASNFAQVVFDETKDVLVEFYAPWCGHCKAFEPKYKELAMKLKSEPNLLLVKIDATVNDIPKNYGISGFPTIYFAPAGKKKEPIKYEGNRDLNDLTDFMKRHASVAFRSKTEL